MSFHYLWWRAEKVSPVIQRVIKYRIIQHDILYIEDIFLYRVENCNSYMMQQWVYYNIN